MAKYAIEEMVMAVTIKEGGKTIAVIKGGTVVRRGRPPRGPYANKRKTLSTRITSTLRTRLDEAADQADRSLSQEIELRLEQSFANDQAKYDAFGGKHIYALMRFLGSAVSLIETGTGRKWRDDRVTYHQVKVTIDKLLYGLGPASAGERDDRTLLEKADAIGETLTAVVLKGEDAKTKRSSQRVMKLLNLASDLGKAMSSEQEWLEARKRLLGYRG